MRSVALYLAMGILAKEKLYKDWHWAFHQKLTDLSKTETFPDPRLPGDRAHPVRLNRVAEFHSVSTERSSSLPPHPLEKTSAVDTAV